MRFLSIICLACLLTAVPALAEISGSSTASNCGEGGNWIDITFTTNEGVTLVDAWWDFNGTSVWLDADGSSVCTPENDGVTSYSFYFDGVVGDDTQDFGMTATGFDSGDYFRFKMDLDLGTTGMPYGADYMGATVTVEFSDATILVGEFDTLYDGTNGATASFSNLANFEFTDRPGWYAPMVPRASDDADWTSVPAPAFLVGECDSTWISSCYQNTGDLLGGMSQIQFHVDGSFLGSSNLWVISPGDYNGPINHGPYNIRGGRHVLRATADAMGQVPEADETDNVFVAQYCFQGDYLAPLALETRAAPPLNDQDFEYGLSGWWNCDGMRIKPSSSYDWCAVWCEREADDGSWNYTLRLHPASDDPEDAFGSNLELSRTDENLHAILINTHTMGAGPWDVGILRYLSHTDDYRMLHTHESPYPFDFGIEPSSPYTVTRLAMFQFHVGTGDLGGATLTLYSNPDYGPVHMGWLAPDFTTGNLEDVLDEVVTDSEGCAQIHLNLTETGEYCAVVYGNRLEHPTALHVNVGLYSAMPDLEPVPLTGWYAPIVPRPAADAALFNVPLPDTLHGGVAQTWMNMAARNDGNASANLVSFGIDVDGAWKWGTKSYVSWGPGQYQNHVNYEHIDEPWNIRGGRHTISSRVDYSEEVDESVERNNDSGRQYCWSPQILPTNGSVEMDTPDALPDRTGGWDNCDGGNTLYPNCDGLRIPYIPQVGGNWWWKGIAVMPRATTQDIDLELHEPLIGTQNGFGPAVLAGSAWGDGQVEFVLINDRVADNTAYDVGVLDDIDTYCPGYYAQEARSTWGGIPGRGAMGPYTMGAGRMLNLHEYLLEEGSWLITLSDNHTDVDWGMSLYQGGMYHGKSDALDDAAAWREGDGETERMLVNVSSGGACLAVWKVDAGEIDKAGSYSLWMAPGISGVDDTPPVVPAGTRLVSASPNPFNPRTMIAFEMERDGPCHLALYDVQGRLVKTLISGDRPAGTHEAQWDGLDDHGSRVASGVYLARLRAAGTTDLLKVTLMK